MSESPYSQVQDKEKKALEPPKPPKPPTQSAEKQEAEMKEVKESIDQAVDTQEPPEKTFNENDKSLELSSTSMFGGLSQSKSEPYSTYMALLHARRGLLKRVRDLEPINQADADDILRLMTMMVTTEVDRYTRAMKTEIESNKKRKLKSPTRKINYAVNANLTNLGKIIVEHLQVIHKIVQPSDELPPDSFSKHKRQQTLINNLNVIANLDPEQKKQLVEALSQVDQGAGKPDGERTQGA